MAKTYSLKNYRQVGGNDTWEYIVEFFGGSKIKVIIERI